jgi:hypothetical protein
MGVYLDNSYINIDVPDGHSSYVDTNAYDVDLGLDYTVSIVATKNTMMTDINTIYEFYPPKVDVFYTFATNIITKTRAVYDKDFNIKVEINLDNYEYIISRSYIKLDAVLANILSMYQILSMIGMTIHKFLSFGKVEYNVMKKLYHFPIDVPAEGKLPSMVIRLNDIISE